MTFDLKRRLKLRFWPDHHAVALEREAWNIIIAEVRKVQAKLSVDIEDEGFEPVMRRIIEDGAPIEIVAVLDGLFGPAGDAFQITSAEVADIDGPGELLAAWDQRARQFLRAAALKEGPTVGHVHHANGNARLP